MVRRLVEHQHICPGNHQLGEHAAHLLASGKHLHLLHAVLTGKEHPPQKSPHIGHIFFRGILGQPLHDGIVIVKLRGVVLGEIGLGGGKPPLVAAGIRLHLPGQNLEKHGLGPLIRPHQGHFVLTAQDEGDIVQNPLPVNGLAEVLHSEHLISNLTEGPEINIGILPAGGFDIIQLDLFQSALSGCRLLGFGCIGREALDKFLKLLNLLLLLAVGLLHLLDDKLAGLHPEVIVARIELNLAVVNVRNLGADLI